MPDGVFQDIHAKELYVSGSTLVVGSNGNVGIGTTSPHATAKLHIKNKADVHLLIREGDDFGAGYSGTAIHARDDAETTNMLVLAGTPISMYGNVGIGTTDQFAGGVKVIGIVEATTPPTSTPTGAGVLYVSGGALEYIGTSGTTTVIASA